MNVSLKSGNRRGEVTIPSSKSVAHRLLICSALSEISDNNIASSIKINGTSKDIEATRICLDAIIKSVKDASVGAQAEPVKLYCGESGSTLRFLLPIVCALGLRAVFIPEGRLANRPLTELSDQLIAGGAHVEWKDDKLYVERQLRSGNYTLPGDVSSQYISGMLFALPLLSGDSRLDIAGKIESESYISLTEDAIQRAGIIFDKDEQGYTIPGGQTYKLQQDCAVEGDWSNAAFFLCAGALSGEGITVRGLDMNSAQGDMKILDVLKSFGAEVNITDSIFVRSGGAKALTIDASQIPDLVPVISVLLCAAYGRSEIINASRLRLKESDRIETTVALINSLGGSAEATDDGIIIYGKGALLGGSADAANDHRIAMAGAVASIICEGATTIVGAECVSKSYPDFWEDFNKLEVI